MNSTHIPSPCCTSKLILSTTLLLFHTALFVIRATASQDSWVPRTPWG